MLRWLSSQSVATIALVMVITITCVSKVSSNAVFELKLKKFTNQYGKDTEGHCCSGYYRSNRSNSSSSSTNSQGLLCSGSCKTKFRVCLKVYQEVIDPSSPCTFGEAVTPVLGENQVDFSKPDLLGDFVNPVQFQLASWQGTFSLIIEAWHEEPNDTVSFVEPVLITRLMTQRWLELGENWNDDDHRTSHSSLSYQYRVICQEHYYGEGCRKWCKPRNDSFGHYNCSASGDLVCLDGWTGTENYCLKPICSAGCNAGTGFCDKPNECKCHVGWEGPNCDQCIVYPGCLHGSCQKPWQCECDEGWGGLFCNQDLNFCTNHKPCKNGAICFNTDPGSYSCECPSGFSGTNCEIINDTCATTPCRNGGTCLDTGDDQFVCQCPSGYTGQYCEISGQSCSDRPCLNGATCSDTATGYQCRCHPGYEGTNCERAVNECASDPCLNGGSCVDEHDGFQCVCPVGYTGPRCQTNIDDCAHRPCLNGGTCIDGLDSFKCRCVPGFLGTLCQTNVDDCRTQPCANGGSCVDGVNNFVCKCREGWGGRQCTEVMPIPVSPCASSPCQNGGYCSERPDLRLGYQCSCPAGVGGPLCTIVTKPLIVGEEGEAMSPAQVVLIVSFSIAIPLLALVSALVIVCMKRRRRRDRARQDEEARRQNEQNMVHNAVNVVNKKSLDDMIFNSLDYPSKPLNTRPQSHHSHQHPQLHHHQEAEFHKKEIENTYSIVPTRNAKPLNNDVSRLSLADRLEKDLDAHTCRGTPTSEINAPCKVQDLHLPRTHSHSDVYTKRSSSSVGCGTADVHTSTNTLTSTCSPSTCTTPSSVYVIEEHYDDENYIATEV